MVEFIGLIKVNVVKGTNLAIRDVMTSDPYVIIALGNQVSLFSLWYPWHYSRCILLTNGFNCVYNIIFPYIYLSQSVKTRVIKSNLNPVWNESLMLSIPENIPPLKLVSKMLWWEIIKHTHTHNIGTNIRPSPWEPFLCKSWSELLSFLLFVDQLILS